MNPHPTLRLRFAHFLVSLLVIPTLIPLPALAQEPAAPTAPEAPFAPAAFVEHWIGTAQVDGHVEFAQHFNSPEWYEPEIADGSSTTAYDLYVDSAGNITGILKVRWSASNTMQQAARSNCLPAVAENSYHGYDCNNTLQPGSGSFTLPVTGKRTRDGGIVKFDLSTSDKTTRAFRTMTGIQFDPDGGWMWTHTGPSHAQAFLPPNIGMRFEGPPVQTYGRVLVEDTQKIDFAYLCCQRKQISFEIGIFEVGTDPTLNLDVELLERSVFMDQVPVPDALTAKAAWQTAYGGKTDWRLPTGPETTPLSPATTINKAVNVGTIGVGEHPVTVKGTDALDRSTIEETLKIVVTRKFERCEVYGAVKQGGAVAYKCKISVPDKPFKGRIDKVPTFIPFFGGKPLGIAEAQANAELELKSTGEGSLQGDGIILIDLMGGGGGGKITVKGDLVVQPAGVKFTGGSLEIKLVVKAKRKESLLTAIPALRVPMILVRALSTEAADFLEKRAEVELAVEGSLGPKFPLVRDPVNDGWKFGDTTVEAGVGFSVEGTLTLIEGKFEGKVKVGGDTVFTFAVPPNPDYLKSIELKFLASATATVMKWEFNAENTYVFKYPGGAIAADGAPQTSADVAAAAIAAGPVFTNTTGWVLSDRSYLTQPGYSQWVGPLNANQSVRGDLVLRTSPQARPAFANYGNYQQWLLWSYERPDNPGAGITPANSDEIAFANLGSAPNYRPPNGYTLMTTDNRSDLNPQIAFVPNLPMVVWERMDTPTPGDFPGNPTGYLSHLQVAASTFPYNAASPVLTPTQISLSGSINHRPQVAPRLYPTEQFLAVWVNNPANRLQGDAANPDRFMYSFYDARTNAKMWTPAQAITGTVPGIRDFDLGSWRDTSAFPTLNGTALIFTADRDGNPATQNDVEIYYTLQRTPTNMSSLGWTPITQLTNNNVNESDVQIEYIGDATSGMEMVAVWRAGNTLMVLRGPSATGWSGTPQAIATLPEQAGSLSLATRAFPTELVVTWTQPEGIGSVRLLANATAWTNPRVLATGNRIPAHAFTAWAISEHPDPALRVGTAPVHVALLETSAEITRTLGGIGYPNFPVVIQRDLFALPDPTLPLSVTILADSVRVLPGTPLRVVATVENRGDVDVPDFALSLVARRPSTASVTLAQQPVSIPNNTRVPVTLTVPALPANALLDLELMKNGCSNVVYGCKPNVVALPTDAVARMGGPTTYAPNATVATLYVGQEGPLFHAATFDVLVRKGRGGPVVASVGARLSTVPAAVISVTAPISTALLGPGEHILEWEIVSDGPMRDPNPSNNIATSLAIVAPDLYMNPYFTAVAGNTVRARVQNVGNWPSGATVLEVWSAPPVTAGAVKLGSIAVPPLAPGAHADLSGPVTAAAETATVQATAAAYLLLDPANTVAEINENSNLTAIAGTTATVGQGKVYLPTVTR